VAADVSSQEQQAAWGTFGAAFAFTLPLVLVLMVAPLVPTAKAVLATNLLPWSQLNGHSSVLTLAGFLGAVLASPVQFGAGGVFYRRAWAALRRGGTNMEVLIALGTSVAYFYSLGSLLAGIAGVPLSTTGSPSTSTTPTSSSGDGGHDASTAPMEGGGAMFFETSAMLITFVSLGKALEAYSKGQTGSAVRSLLALQEPEATLLEHADDSNNSNMESLVERRRRSSISASSSPVGTNDHDKYGENSNGGGGANGNGGAAMNRRSSRSGSLTAGDNSRSNLDPATWADASLYSEVRVDCRLLQRGDLVLVLGGARLPCDGVLVRTLSGGGNGGMAAVDEAMLTGEAMPVNKRIGDNLLGGTVRINIIRAHCRRQSIQHASVSSSSFYFLFALTSIVFAFNFFLAYENMRLC
jgi:Cu+-exporting ATPase